MITPKQVERLKINQVLWHLYMRRFDLKPVQVLVDEIPRTITLSTAEGGSVALDVLQVKCATFSGRHITITGAEFWDWVLPEEFEVQFAERCLDEPKFLQRVKITPDFD